MKIIPGPDRRNKQPKGLARVAFDVEAHGKAFFPEQITFLNTFVLAEEEKS